MKTGTKIKDLFVFEGFNYSDNRGDLVKPVSLVQQEIDFKLVETWFTRSKKNVIRGMHMQVEPFPINKLVSVIQGQLIDVILDCRAHSPTYGTFEEFYLEGSDNKLLQIPSGCAHGYKVLENNTTTMYMSDNIHHGPSDIGFKYDSFGYDWGIENPIISEKDKNLPNFEKKQY